MALLINKKPIILIIFFLLGLLLSLAFDPYNLPFFSVIIVGLFFLMNDQIYKYYNWNYKFIFCTGLMFGFSFFISSIYWISNSVLIYPDLKYLLPIPLIGLPFVLGIFYGLMQILNFFFWSKNISRVLYFPIIWTFFEILRSTAFTGLPWNILAYSWTWSLYMMQSLSIFGVYGLCLLTCLVASCLFSFKFNKKNYFISSVVIFIFLLIYFYGVNRVESYHNEYVNDEKIRLIGTNFNQEDKWKNESIQKAMLLGSNEIITIFPETSIGFTKKIPTNWLTGSVRKENDNYYNSMQFGRYFYDKQKLVPFTELLPFEKFVKLFNVNNIIPENFFTAGDTNQEFDKRILPSICYEGIFPTLILSKLTEDAEVIVNISNDAWFGKYTGPKQHLTHIQYRTIETGLPLIRSTNKGFSVLVNPIGKVIAEIPKDELGFIDIKIPKKIEPTIYSKYGDFPFIIFIALSIIILYILEKKYLIRENKDV